ncbi:MAG: YggS family pyridoxal phosphate-dependent enzyme [Burkholderiales bacterium]|nr:YggS family pyridoxal phosphate-dependent enzyme [Burkholderiales bacterium]
MDGKSVLEQNCQALAQRIDAACRAAQRARDEVSLLAVSKTFPADRVLALAALGQRRFGENYLQEALDKIAECAARAPDVPLEWHFIGPIQSNKTRPIAEHFDWVHSVDRERIARRLSEQRPAGMAPLQVCIQVNIGDEDSKSGCEPGQAAALARLVAGLPGLRLRGLMAIPRPLTDPMAQQAQFAQVRALLAQLRSDGLAVDVLSMGMSDDLEAAIAQGATIVRVGSALFGRRPAPVSDPGAVE